MTSGEILIAYGRHDSLTEIVTMETAGRFISAITTTPLLTIGTQRNLVPYEIQDRSPDGDQIHVLLV